MSASASYPADSFINGPAHGNPPLYWSTNLRPPVRLFLGSHYISGYNYFKSDADNDWDFAPNVDAYNFTVHFLGKPNSQHGQVPTAFTDGDMVQMYHFHGHNLGFLFETYLDLVCTVMHNVRRSVVAEETVTQFADQNSIIKLRLYRMIRGIHVGRAILKEIVYAVDNLGNPLMEPIAIWLAEDSLQQNEEFLIPNILEEDTSNTTQTRFCSPKHAPTTNPSPKQTLLHLAASEQT
ncbi:ribosomal RNA small subunit methyltransferase H [Striga asiatica]|uniref:Ribosomal RNA small subunit methyltransferase H n=1 Tax=Striga asiatica TaxID=4170 RepID=A0A5A7QP12_STRAF|nr:ribosomal RNA small subunit methyltransferase H [Striga asiatica]